MWELKKEIETRKENLIYTLKNKKEFLELEKQHQIYGAIKELSHVLGLIECYRENEILSKPRRLEMPVYQEAEVEAAGGDEEEEEMKVQVQKKSVLRLVSERVRTFKSPIRIKFSKNDA
jgi:hypothetical protein